MQAYTQTSLQTVADSVDTGEVDVETSRALIIFNLTDEPLNGVVRFCVDMSWRDGRELPPVEMTHLTSGRRVRCRVNDLIYQASEIAGAKGRLTFNLLFEIHTINSACYDSYIARYVQNRPQLLLNDERQTTISSYRVVETLRHSGSLPPSGHLPLGNL